MCVFIKLHITAQSGLVILVILCHSQLLNQPFLFYIFSSFHPCLPRVCVYVCVCVYLLKCVCVGIY